MDRPTVHAAPPPALVGCSTCSLREFCLPVGLPADDMRRVDGLVSARRNVRRGEALFRDDDEFTSLYAIRAGFFKTCATSRDGREQVTGFMMAGDLMGFDGIGHDRHCCDAIALEDSQVCVIPYARLEEVSRSVPELQRQLHRIMSREIVREHGVIMMLAGMRADERLAAFLSNLARRLELRGFSPSALILRMTRQEIGTYLGLKLETVSRCFTRLCDDGILDVRHRHVRILDPAGLQRLVAGRQRSRA